MAMERENRAPRGVSRKRRKVCQFCVDKCEHIDYKDAAKLRRFISERSKILPFVTEYEAQIQSITCGRAMGRACCLSVRKTFSLFYPI